MRVICPACEATYDVPDTLLGGEKRRVRCTRCEYEWEFDAPPPEETGPETDEVPTEIPDEPPEETGAETGEEAPSPPPLVGEKRPHARSAAEPTRPGRGPLLGWILSVLIILCAAGAAVHFRAGIIHAWPPSERAYSWFGLASAPSHTAE
jgi:predicted Zn finger-like uncharacterized protein